MLFLPTTDWTDYGPTRLGRPRALIQKTPSDSENRQQNRRYHGD